MFKTYVLIYLVIHLLGDFYLQGDRLAQMKFKSIKKLIRHDLIYLAAGVIVVIPVMLLYSRLIDSRKILISVVVLACAHALVDFMKYLYIKYRSRRPVTRKTSAAVYIADQAIHILCLIAVAYFMALSDYYLPSSTAQNVLSSNMVYSAGIYAAGGAEKLKWVAMLLLIFKPANVTIKQLLYTYRPARTGRQLISGEKTDGMRDKELMDKELMDKELMDKEVMDKEVMDKEVMAEEAGNKEARDKEVGDEKSAGAFIGSLERLLLLLFLSLGQFGAVGLVLTAKSVARYNKIAEDKEFAEYYLIGTLLSTVFVVAAFMMVM